MSTANYNSFPSIERLENIYCVISEKIDGTNGLIEINEVFPVGEPKEIQVRFGSRNCYITFNNDNAGFANFFRHYEARFKDVAADIILKELEVSGEMLYWKSADPNNKPDTPIMYIEESTTNELKVQYEKA